MLLPVLLTTLPLALAANRVFNDLGSATCQRCLAAAPAACSGPVSSSQFNDCFCAVSGSGAAAWKAVAGCLADKTTECYKVKESILGAFGAHCFAHKRDEKELVCVAGSEQDELLLSLADSFCTEFVTLTSSGAASATATSSGSKTDATASGAAADTTSKPTAKSTSSAESTTTAEPTTAPSTTESTATPHTTAGPDLTEGSPAGTQTTSTSTGAAANLVPLSLTGVSFLALLIGGAVSQSL